MLVANGDGLGNLVAFLPFTDQYRFDYDLHKFLTAGGEYLAGTTMNYPDSSGVWRTAEWDAATENLRTFPRPDMPKPQASLIPGPTPAYVPGDVQGQPLPTGSVSPTGPAASTPAAAVAAAASSILPGFSVEGVMDWLKESTIFPSVPNGLLVLGAGAALFALSGGLNGGGRRHR